MKCCGSPIIFTAVSARDTSNAAATALQAVLFSEIFKPLAQGLGPVGDVAVSSVAQTLALRGGR